MSSIPDNEIVATVCPTDSSSTLKRSPTLLVESQQNTMHLKKLMIDLERSSTSISGDQIDHMLPSVAESAAFLTRSDFISIVLKQANAAGWQLKAKQGSIDPLLERTCNQIMLGVLTSVYEFDNVYMPNLDQITLQDQTHYLMCVPLVKNRQILGGMLIVKADGKSNYSEQEVASAFLLGQWCSQRLVGPNSAKTEEKELLSYDRLGLVIERTRDEERQRIAADLHDGIAQWMLRVAYDIDECRTLLAIGETGDLKKSLVATKKTVQKCIQEVRRAIADLKPTPIIKYGLSGAISRKATELTAQGIHCVVSFKSKLPPLNDVQEKSIYWITEEALNNIQKHSKATAAIVEIGYQLGTLEVTVSDRGRGFSTIKSTQDEPALKQGLKGMHIRASQIGGTLTVESVPGAGTTVKFLLPNI